MSSSVLSYIVNIASVALFIVGLFIRKLSCSLKDDVLLLVGAILAILYLLGFVFAEKLALIAVSNCLSGASDVVILASSYSYASKLIPPERRGKQFAVFNATLFLSWGIPGTFVAGPIVDYLIKRGASPVFSYKMSFLAAAILVFIGMVVISFIVGMRKRTSRLKRYQQNGGV